MNRRLEAPGERGGDRRGRFFDHLRGVGCDAFDELRSARTRGLGIGRAEAMQIDLHGVASREERDVHVPAFGDVLRLEGAVDIVILATGRVHVAPNRVEFSPAARV